MKGGKGEMLRRFETWVLSCLFVVFGATAACAEFTVPTLPVTDLETAGAAVAGLVAAYVLIKIVIRMIKGA